jgi:hypothetical protein
MERRLNASARFLDYGERLQLVNSVLSSLPNHYLSSLKVHKTIIKIADRSRRDCLYLFILVEMEMKKINRDENKNKINRGVPNTHTLSPPSPAFPNPNLRRRQDSSSVHSLAAWSLVSAQKRKGV